MYKFEVGKEYMVTKNGYKYTDDTKRVIMIGQVFIKFVSVQAEKNGFYEVEKVKIRRSDSGSESAWVFGGLITDTVYAEDVVY